MELKIYQVDAFAEKVFSGNPAAVIPLSEWLSDEIMQNIALENNLSETAFFVREANGLHIRWFTPGAEVDLCGHATLATAHILFTILQVQENPVQFNSKSGILKVEKTDNIYWLDFPVSTLKKVDIPKNLISAFNVVPIECWRGRDDFMLVFKNEETIHSLQPDFNQIIKSQCRGLIVTTPGNELDFVSRFFAPTVGINEDPVTGSAHTMLIPYWSEKLGKKEMMARQVSKRSGNVKCISEGERVKIGGEAITYMEGIIKI
ncbi:MAG: PhzF family phenazine biosynthesis protein [Mariniphaga sp.]|nr:PhzF family phenazine biosynthesis protein [Mariniphaga sp.]